MKWFFRLTQKKSEDAKDNSMKYNNATVRVLSPVAATTSTTTSTTIKNININNSNKKKNINKREEQLFGLIA